MKFYLKALDLRKLVENGYTKPKSRPKGLAAKKLHRDNEKAISAIMSDLSDSNNNKVGQCMTTK